MKTLAWVMPDIFGRSLLYWRKLLDRSDISGQKILSFRGFNTEQNTQSMTGNAFVTWFASDDYLPGVLALNTSVKWFHPEYSLVVVLTKQISKDVMATLSTAGCTIKMVDEISNPHDDSQNFNHYTKLRIFELSEYYKVIFLDADMIVCDSLEHLFERDHMSSVIAGGLIKSMGWVDLNGGLLVIRPSKELFYSMLGKIGSLPSADGSDQGFLQSFYPEWPLDKGLHLDHRYNVPVPYLDQYCGEHGFEFEYKNEVLLTNICILHYWGPVKPWKFNIKAPADGVTEKYLQAMHLWYDFHLLALQEIKLSGLTDGPGDQR